jgi:hypothetical protein
MSGHAPEERFKPDAAENARKARGAASTARSVKHRKDAPPFDWDAAIALFKQTLNEVYGK